MTSMMTNPETMSLEKAQKLTSDLKRVATWLETAFDDIVTGKPWLVMGYETFYAWWDGEGLSNIKVTAPMRVKLVELLHLDTPKLTQREMSEALGVTQGTVSNDMAIINFNNAQLSPEDMAKLPVKELTKVLNRINREQRTAKAEVRRRQTAEAAAALPFLDPASVRVEHVDFREMRLDNASVDVILTDPPYPAEFLPLYSDLSRIASQILKPGGMCAVMVGEAHLPEVLFRLTEHLTYRWTMAYLTPGGQAAQVFPAKVNSFWKPVILLSNGPIHDDAAWIGDVVSSNVNDNQKDDHKWQQSTSGMAALLEKASSVGDLVFDPFCGSGTTGVVALQSQRRFMGCDIEQASVDATKVRVHEVLNGA
jgi:16S rRNA G966 N2-methylase RsmD